MEHWSLVATTSTPGTLAHLSSYLCVIAYAPQTTNSNHTYYFIMYNQLSFMQTYEIRVENDSCIP